MSTQHRSVRVLAALYVAAVPTATLATMNTDRARRVVRDQGGPLLDDPTFGQADLVSAGLSATVAPCWLDQARAAVCRQLVARFGLADQVVV